VAKNYPEDSLQSGVGDWWVSVSTGEVARGRLLWAFVPYVDQQPLALSPVGRSDPTDHLKATYRLEPLRAKEPPRPPALPVAGLPSLPGEVRTVYRSKRRPVLVLGMGGTTVTHELRTGAAKWQTHPTLIVAPYFGVDPGPRGGWKPEFVERIRRCEYPQYMWEQLPVGGSSESSILAFGQMQAIGNTADAYELTNFSLSEAALTILDEWLEWFFNGKLDQEGVLFLFRKELAELEKTAN
jgi:hypothetical protein